jgi:hypothetical protein
MAAAHPSHRQRGAPHRPVTLDGLEGVRGAARDETAGRGSTGAHRLVQQDAPADHPSARAHAGTASRTATASSCTCPDNPANVRATAAGSARNTYAPDGSGVSRCSSASTARRRRRRRLRVTAVPTRRPMAQPTRTRARSSAGDASSTVTVIGPLRTRRPWRRTAAWDERPWRRLRPTAGAGPCGAGRRALPDRLWSTCGDGTRGAWLACDCSADRCASLTPPRPEGRRAATAADAIPCPFVLDRCSSMRSMAVRPSGRQVGTAGRAKRGSCDVQARGSASGGQRAPG